MSASPLARARGFAQRVGTRVPILLAPMAGACPPSLSIAVANSGGLGACGALMMSPDEITAWSAEFRAGSAGGFQINLWIPDLPPKRDSVLETRQREFLSAWGPVVAQDAGDIALQDFDAQCRAVLTAAPKAVSSIMGLYPASLVAELKARGIIWLATATTVAEAKAAEQTGADAVIAQGVEAGGHRGAFHPGEAEHEAAGLMALLPQIADAVNVPVIAAGGIADGRGIAAALMLGASAVQIGTGLLRTPEARTHPAYAERLGRTGPDETMVTRAFSGRPGRSVATAYVRAASTGPGAAPYPVQRGLTAGMREAARRTGDAERMQMWAGQAAKLALAEPAGVVVRKLWDDAVALLNPGA
jgi:nitronate monooxygenase